MEKKWGKRTAERAIISLTVVGYGIAYHKTPIIASRALRYSTDIFFEVILLVTAAILLGGLVKASIPSEFVPKFLGSEGGPRAYLNSVAIASIIPGEGYVRMPLLEAILEKGAGLGPFASLNTCRPVIVNLPQGIAFLGLPIALIQVISTIIGALCAGLFARAVELATHPKV